MSTQQQTSLLPKAKVNNRLIEPLIKNIKQDPFIALTELIANAWDAGATEVVINWPTETSSLFSISDNGHGMTDKEFISRWLTAGYDRRKEQSKAVEIHHQSGASQNRTTYGKNGVGKFASLCFAEEYSITTCKNGKEHKYIIKENISNYLFDVTAHEEKSCSKTGVTIAAITPKPCKVPEKVIQEEIAKKFIFDPSFSVTINGTPLSFDVLPTDSIHKEIISVEEGEITMNVVVDQKISSSLRFNGIGWHVNGRPVGKASWKLISDETLFDGRTGAARKHAVILEASCLEDFVKPDWTGFEESSPAFQTAIEEVKKHILDFFHTLNEDTREERKKEAKQNNDRTIKKLGHVSRQKLDMFLDETLKQCPSIKANDLKIITGILATIETTTGKFSILERLSQLDKTDWEKLNTILSEWTVSMAKEVLDEIRNRLIIVNELRLMIEDTTTLEVQDLQPMMEKCLWIFGPEFESIHYTSNETITTNIAKLANGKIKYSSANRPDFVVWKDTATSFHSVDAFDEDCHENGIEKLVIIELKAPGINLGRNEKNQPLKYYDELKLSGAISEDTTVKAYVLGTRTQQKLSSKPIEEGNCTVSLMTFSSLLKRAESRLFNMQNKLNLHSAPFLKTNEPTLIAS